MIYVFLAIMKEGFIQPNIHLTISLKIFINCYNNDTKSTNFYFDSDNKIYKVCYETCLTCDKGGDEYINNCLTCDVNHIKKPETPNTTNYVPNVIMLIISHPMDNISAQKITIVLMKLNY